MYSRAPSSASLSSLLRGTLAFTENLSPSKFAWLATFSHSRAHLYEHPTYRGVHTATGYTLTHIHTEAWIENQAAQMFPSAPSWWGYLLCYMWLICSSLQQLRRGVDPMSTKWLTEPWVDSSLWTFPWEINILTECRCHVLAGEQHWNTTLSCLTLELAVLSFRLPAMSHLGCKRTFL